MQVLVVEDEEKLAAALREGLGLAGYSVSVAATGGDGLRMAQQGRFDAIVLDVMLPGIDGLTILRQLREEGSATPVLMLTARDALGDRVRGLDAGADDYLVKPFALPELLARLRAVTRRRGARSETVFTLADLSVDRLARQASRSGRELVLTPREFDLLAYLIQHAGQLVPREMIAHDVWKSDSRGTPLDNVIDVHLVRLRKKVDEGFTPRLIHTVRGLGVRLAASPE